MKKNDLNNRIARVFEEVATIIFNQLRGQYLAKFIPGGTAAEVAKQIEKSPVSVGCFTPEVWEVVTAESYTISAEGEITINVDSFTCRFWHYMVFSLCAKFETIARIKPANRPIFAPIAEVKPTAPEVAPVAEVEELPAVEVVEVETVAEVAPVAEVEDIEPEPEQHHTSAALFINGYIAAMVAVMAAFIVFVVKPQTPTASAMVAPAQVAMVAAAPVAEPEPEAEPEVIEISATLENVEIMPDYEARTAEIERVKAYLIAHYVHPQPIDLTAEEIEEPEVMPIDCTPIYSNSEELKEIADTITEEDADTADTITEEDSDTADTLTDGSTYDYSCNGYTVIVVESYDSNGELITASYVVPLNE